MLGSKRREQLDLFVAGSLEQLIPEDHILFRVNRVLDSNWLREEVADCYCADNGRPGLNPEVVDDERGVVLDVTMTEGTWNEREMMEPRLKAVRKFTGRESALVTADSGYPYFKVYAALERRLWRRQMCRSESYHG